LGDYGEAERLYRSALQWQPRLLGRRHPQTATTLLHYAWMLADQRAAGGSRSGDPGKIEAMFREVLQIRRQQLGDQHRDTAVAMTGLLAILAGDGREAEAKELLVPALQIYQAQPGGEPIGMAVSLFITGGLARGKGNLDKAISDYEKAIDIGREVLGDRHPLLAFCLGELAGTYKQARRYEQAEAAVLEALEIARTVTKHGHPAMIPALVELASWRYEHQQYEACERLDLEAIRIAKHFEPYADEATLCESLLRCGFACYARAEFDSAAEYYRQIIDIGIPTSAAGYWVINFDAALGLANIERARHDFDAAYRRINGIYGSMVANNSGPPTEHAHQVRAALAAGIVGILIDKLSVDDGTAQQRRQLESEISTLLANALRYREVRMIRDQIVIGQNLYEAARWELRQGNIDQAVEYIQESIDLLKHRLPHDSWIIAAAETTHAACLIEQQQHEQAKTLLAPALKTLTKTLGADNFRTKESRWLIANPTDTNEESKEVIEK